MALCVLGTALVRQLICNIYRRNEEIPLTNMQSPQPSVSLKSTLSQDNMESLLQCKALRFPHTFDRARKLAKAARYVLDCLKQGLVVLKTWYFPLVNFMDLKTTLKMNWN